MPLEILTERVPLVTAFGFTVVEVELDFIFDEDTCLYEYSRPRLSRNGVKLLGTGINYFLTAVQLGPTRLEECESPANTCRKVITIGIQLRRSFSVAGNPGGTTLIVSFSRRYATNCLRACCS